MFNSDNLRLDGKCAIITGAGAGIGKEIAITFATAGASVVVSDINADAANHVVDEIQQLGGQAFACRCDITSEQELSALADFAISKLGKVDILVNNAGGGGPKPFDMPMADFRRAYELNVFSFFHLSQLVAPEMEKNGGGVILTITSMAAENKNINMTSYASSKAAASHLVRNMAFDLGEKNIRVNGIAPGAILTDALKSVTIRCGLRRMDRSMRKIRNRFHIRGMCIGGRVPSSAPESLSASPCHDLRIAQRPPFVKRICKYYFKYCKNILNIAVFSFLNQSGNSSFSSHSV